MDNIRISWLKNTIICGMLLSVTACTTSYSLDRDKPRSQDYSEKRVPRGNAFIAQGGYSQKSKQNPFTTSAQRSDTAPAPMMPDDEEYYYDDHKPETLSGWMSYKSRKEQTKQQGSGAQTVEEWLNSSYLTQTSTQRPPQSDYAHSSSMYFQDNPMSNDYYMDEGSTGSHFMGFKTAGDRRLPKGNIAAFQSQPSASAMQFAPAEGSGDDASYSKIASALPKVPIAPVVSEHITMSSSHLSAPVEQVRRAPRYNPPVMHKQPALDQATKHQAKSIVTQAATALRSLAQRYGFNATNAT